MDDSQLEHVGMFIKVKTFLSKKASDLTATPVIAASLQPALISQIDLILEEDEDASSTISGSTELKRNLREAVENTGFEVSAACVSHYTITAPNPVLRTKCEFDRSELSRFRDADLYVKMKLVHEIADPIKALLAPFGVVPADVDDLATALANYFAELQGPRDAIGERSASGKQVARLILQTRELLDQKLDVVMKFYLTNNPELHDYYLSARGIDQTGGGPIPSEDEEFILTPGQFVNGPTPPEVSANSRFVIMNKTENGAIVRVGFSNSENGFANPPIEVAPFSTVDLKAIELGYAPGIPFFVFQNSGHPIQTNIVVRVKAYF